MLPFEVYEDTVAVGCVLDALLHRRRKLLIINGLSFIDQLRATAAEETVDLDHLHDTLQHSGGTSRIDKYFIAFFTCATERFQCARRDLVLYFIDQCTIHIKKQCFHIYLIRISTHLKNFVRGSDPLTKFLRIRKAPAGADAFQVSLRIS